MQEISIRLKADTAPAQQSVRELENKLKNLSKVSQNDPLIREVDIKNFQRLNSELGKLLQNLSRMNSQMGRGGGGGIPSLPHGGGGGFEYYGRKIAGSILSYLSLSNLYHNMSQGRELIKSEEAYAAGLGTRIGGYGSDFRRTRLDFTATGAQYNMRAMETMQIANTYMSLAGAAGIRRNVSDILYASKGLGLDPNTLAQSFGMMGRMGSTNMREFAEILAGTIKKTGMQGREDELINAIQGLTQSAYQNQLKITNQERNNLIGLLAYLGSKDSSLKGEKGAQVAGGLQSMLQNGGSDEELLAIMGYGSRYKGTKGYWQLQERLSKGLTDPQNLRDLMIGLNQWQADPYMKRIWLMQHSGLSPDAVDFLMRPDVQRDIMSGKITQSMINQLEKSGKTTLQQNFTNRMKSNAEQRAKWDVFWENTQKSLGETLDKIMLSIQSFFTDNFSPDSMAAMFGLGSLGAGFGGKYMVNRLFKYFRGGRKPPSGGGGLSSLWESITGFGSRIWRAFSSGEWIPPIPLPDDFLRQSINGSPVAMGGGKLQQTSLDYAYGWGSKNFVNAFGWGSQDFRTLEARQSDLLTKEDDLLRKKEDLLNKEDKVFGSRSTNNNDLTNAVTKMANTTKEMFDQYTGQTNNTMMRLMQLGFSMMGGGAGGLTGGMTSVSYGGGSGSSFLNMNLKDGYNMTAAEVNAWIDKYAPKNSILRGQGAAFVEAARRTGLDVRYLVAHAALETGWGTSRIARDKHNFFGIGAIDSNPYGGASSWDSVAAGIIGGAEWIARNYTNRGQNTLYSMAHGGSHTYASDPMWDEKIAQIMAGAPTATLNVKVSGGITGLTAANNDLVAQSLAAKINSAPNLAYVFTQGAKGVTV